MRVDIFLLLLVLAASVTTPLHNFKGQAFADSSLYEEAAKIAVTMNETIAISSTGSSCNISLIMTIENSTLSSGYRDLFDFQDDRVFDERINITEFVPLNYTMTMSTNVSETAEAPITINENTSVREQFLTALHQEHLFSFGINITDWRAHEMWGVGGAIGLLLAADAELLQVNSSSSTREIMIGPENLNASFGRADFVLAKIALVQHMLNTSAEEVYESEWNTAFCFDLETVLNNAVALEAKYWNAYFGGGTFMEANVTEASSNYLVLNETMVVNQSAWTVTEQELLEQGLLCYKIFKMELENTSPLPLQASGGECSGGIYDDWSMTWSLNLWEGEVEWQYNEFISLRVYSKLVVEGKVYWEFKWFKLKKFGAWIRLHPTLRVNVTVTGQFELGTSYTLYEWTSDPKYFHVGVVVGWYEITFSPIATLDISGDLGVKVTCAANATGTLQAGANWKKDRGWRKIFKADMNVNTTGPEVSMDSWSATIVPGVEFELALLFYSTAGPHVTFKPYAEIELDSSVPIDWNVTVGLEVLAGVAFAGWVKRLLDLNRWDWSLANLVFCRFPVPYHDVAVTDVRADGTAFVTEPVTIDVDVLNHGNFPEDLLDVTVYYEQDGTEGLIGTQSGVNLPVGNATTLTFAWDTASRTSGNYTIRANATISDADHNETDNTASCAVYLEVKDIAIVALAREGNYDGSLTSIDINITVANLGTVNISSVLVFVYSKHWGEEALEPISDVWCEYLNIAFDVTVGEECTLNFTWQTGYQGVDPAEYTIVAYASELLWEADTENNFFMCYPYDINGDGYVGIDDIIAVAEHFGCSPGDSEWSQKYDVTYDGYVGIDDIVGVAEHFGN